MSAPSPALSFPRVYNATCHFIDRHLAEGRGDKTAVLDHQGAVTYAELAERVNRAGNALRGLDVRMEERVLLCLLDGRDFPAVFFGAMKIGAVPVPVNTLLQPDDYAYLLDDSRARVLVVSSSLYPKFEPILGTARFLQHVVIVGDEDEGPGKHAHLGALLRAAEPTLAAAPTTPDDVAFWLYSSGSTGRPKGAVHLHSHLQQTAMLYGERVLGITADDVVFSAAKSFFAYGLGNGLTFPFHVGATAVYQPDRATPDTVMRVLRDKRPTIFYGVPTLYASILADPKNGRETGSDRLRVCVSAGEALPKEIGEKWFERFDSHILDGIGSTEMLHIFMSNRLHDVRYGTSGRPVPGYDVKLVDDSGEPVPDGEDGSLWVRGPSSCVAYWNQRQKSLDTFHGAWTRTGDRYVRDAEGYFTYAGRSDDMLKVSGIWVSPFEVESALTAHEAVLEAAVVGHADEAKLVKPKAFVVLKRPDEASPALADVLKDFVKGRLAPYKYPRWIEFVRELPKTATGKIQRYKLREG